MHLEQEQVAITQLTRRISRHRAAVVGVVAAAPQRLTIADVRRLARERDPSLSTLLLVSAADELRRQGRIQLVD